MLPIRDVQPTRVRPWVTWLLIAACVYVFFNFQNQATEAARFEFLYERAAVACEVVTGRPLSVGEIESQICDAGAGEPVFAEKQPWTAVLTSMFLHGDLAHLLFNMWFLWIFGNNVEEAFGHFRYILLYLIGGVIATLAFVGANPLSTVPLVGASGAIAAVLGAYGVLFPTHRILTLFGWLLLPFPAIVFLAIWFVSQFQLGGTNTAWEAHVGGFVVGFIVALAFRRSLLRRVAVAHRIRA